MNVTISSRQRIRKINSRWLRQLTREALELSQAPARTVHVVLVDDRRMATLNARFHQTPGPTDVLCFDYQDDDRTVELVISVPQACAQAARWHTSPEEEVTLYLVHGLLHLCGYDDDQPLARRQMRRAERRLLARLQGRLPLPDGVGRTQRRQNVRQCAVRRIC